MTKKPGKNKINSQRAAQDSMDSAQNFRDLLLNLGRNPTLPVPDRAPAKDMTQPILEDKHDIEN